MTTYGRKTVTCAICGRNSEQKILLGTNYFGSYDLDLRPPKMARSTMSAWLQECSDCGYVAKSLDVKEDGEEKFLTTEAFTTIQNGALSGKLIGRFLKRSLLDNQLGKMMNAAYYSLCAAWVADDDGDPLAIDYRGSAADFFLAAASEISGDADILISTQARTIDILRRARRFDEAVSVADNLLRRDDLSTMVRSITEFEKQLAQAHDVLVYTVDDALPELDEPTSTPSA